MMLNHDPDVWRRVLHTIKTKLKHIQDSQIFLLRSNQTHNPSKQFLLNVCYSLSAAAHDHIELIKNQVFLEGFYPFIYTQYDLIHFDRTHSAAQGLHLLPGQRLTVAHINHFFSRLPVAQQSQRAVFLYDNRLYRYQRTPQILASIIPDTRNAPHCSALQTRLQLQVPFVIEKNNTALRDHILQLTTSYSERNPAKDADFDTLKKLILAVRDGIDAQKSTYDGYFNKAILVCLIGLLFLSIGLSLLYWPAALSYVSTPFILTYIIDVPTICVLSAELIFFGLVGAVPAYLVSKQASTALMALNHPPALSSRVGLHNSLQRPGEMDLNRFFTEYEPNLKALFPQRTGVQVNANANNDEDEMTDSDDTDSVLSL
ncbi:MAG: hypothetical protein CK424_06020 [Legionella sp.]|nr:MAG: hypothetical protein CK424_06020 [Legionella sp.]